MRDKGGAPQDRTFLKCRVRCSRAWVGYHLVTHQTNRAATQGDSVGVMRGEVDQQQQYCSPDVDTVFSASKL